MLPLFWNISKPDIKNQLPPASFPVTPPLSPSSLQIMQLDFVCRSTFLWLMIKMTLRRLPAISLKKAPKIVENALYLT